VQQSISSTKTIVYVCADCNKRITKQIGQVEYSVKRIKYANGLMPYHSIHLCKKNYVIQNLQVDHNFDVRTQSAVSINPPIRKNNNHLIPMVPQKKETGMRTIQFNISEIHEITEQLLSFSITDNRRHFSLVFGKMETQYDRIENGAYAIKIFNRSYNKEVTNCWMNILLHILNDITEPTIELILEALRYIFENLAGDIYPTVEHIKSILFNFMKSNIQVKLFHVLDHTFIKEGLSVQEIYDSQEALNGLQLCDYLLQHEAEKVLVLFYPASINKTICTIEKNHIACLE